MAQVDTARSRLHVWACILDHRSRAARLVLPEAWQRTWAPQVMRP